MRWQREHGWPFPSLIDELWIYNHQNRCIFPRPSGSREGFNTVCDAPHGTRLIDKHIYIPRGLGVQLSQTWQRRGGRTWKLKQRTCGKQTDFSSTEALGPRHTQSDAAGCIKMTSKWWLWFGRNIYQVYTVFLFWEWKRGRSGLNQFKLQYLQEKQNKTEVVNWDTFPQLSESVPIKGKKCPN